MRDDFIAKAVAVLGPCCEFSDWILNGFLKGRWYFKCVNCGSKISWEQDSLEKKIAENETTV